MNVTYMYELPAWIVAWSEPVVQECTAATLVLAALGIPGNILIFITAMGMKVQGASVALMKCIAVADIVVLFSVSSPGNGV